MPITRRNSVAKRPGIRTRAVITKKPKVVVKKSTKKAKKSGPFADIGRVAGSYIGRMFGSSKTGANIGRGLGNIIGSIFGTGDYHSNESLINTNSIMNPAKPVPVVNSMVTHGPQFNFKRREYLGDIYSSVGFSLQQFPLQPGSEATFPWLNQVAQNFEQYRINGMIFEFVSLSGDALTSTNTSLGYVAMATQYDALDAPFTTKQQIENYEFAQSCKPSRNQIHGIECKKSVSTLTELYVRVGAVPIGSDQRFYDFGTFNIATGGFQAGGNVCGELWVSYDISFFKPRIPPTVGGSQSSGRALRSSSSGSNPLGTIGVKLLPGTLNLTCTSTTISFTPVPGNYYLLMIYWSGTSVAVTLPTFTYTNLGLVNLWNNDTQAQIGASQNGLTMNGTFYNASFQASTNLNPGGTAQIVLGVGGTIPNGFVDVFVLELDNSIYG